MKRQYLYFECSRVDICVSVIFKNKTTGDIVCISECSEVQSKHSSLVTTIATTLIEEHRVFINVLCFVGKGVISKSRMGEKQRRIVQCAYESEALYVFFLSFLKNIFAII